MPGGSPRWLLIGNSRWHWAVAKGGELRVEHGPPPVKALEPGWIDDLVAWAAVGPLPTAVSLPPQRRLGLEQVPLAELPPWLGLDRALAGWLAAHRRADGIFRIPGMADDAAGEGPEGLPESAVIMMRSSAGTQYTLESHMRTWAIPNCPMLWCRGVSSVPRKARMRPRTIPLLANVVTLDDRGVSAVGMM